MPDNFPERGAESRFLNGLYPDLSKSADVGKIALQAGVPDTAPPTDKIRAYLNHLEAIEGSEEQERVIHEIIESSIREPIEPNPDDTETRRMVHPGFAQEIEGFGYDGVATPDKVADVIREHQRASLQSWFDYLYGEEQEFPTWFRFYVVSDLVRMSAFNQERSEFPRRSQNDNLMFPELDQEALAKTRETTLDILNGETPDIPEEVSKNPRFRNLYGYHYNNLRSIPEDELQITDGEWTVFERGSDPALLAETLSGRGSGWCLAVYGDAARYLKRGDVIIYFSEDKQGEAINPRIAIATDVLSALLDPSAIKPGFRDKHTISEIRGILNGQEMEPVLFDTIEEKLRELDGAGNILKAENYLERLPGLRSLAAVEEKIDADQPLSDEELALIYGIPSTPVGFGNVESGHLTKLRERRDVAEDCEILFGVRPEAVALGLNQLDEKTIVYISTLLPAMPNRLPDSLKIVVGDLLATALQGTNSLGNLDTIWGDIHLAHAYDITSLGKLRMVSGDVITYRDEHVRMSRLNDIGELEFVGGSIELMPSRIRDLKGLQFIGGDATFPTLPIEAFDNLQFIGGNATIIGIDEAEFRRSVHVGGEVTVIERAEYKRSRSKLREFFMIFGDDD